MYEYKSWKFNDVPLEEWKRNIDEWGCPYDPRDVIGPIGMYHCEGCGHMVVAGLSHPMIDPETLELIEEGCNEI